MEKIFDIAKDSEKSWGNLASSIDKNFNEILYGGNSSINCESINAFDGVYLDSVIGNVVIEKTTTTLFSLSQFKIEKGDSLKIIIPKSSDSYRYVWAFMSDEITEAPSERITYAGNCPEPIKGNSNPLEFQLTNNTDYPYLIVGYNSSGGIPSVTKEISYPGILGMNDKSNDTIYGVDGIRSSKSNMGNGDYIALLDYPTANTIGECYSFRANISSFDKIEMGRGQFSPSPDSNIFGNIYNCWLRIDGTNIQIYRDYGTQLGQDIPHGLTITGYISISMRLADDNKMYLKIMTSGGFFTTVLNDYYIDATGVVKVVSVGSIFTSCQLSAINTHFKSPLWIFGASFEEQNGWQLSVKSMGFSNYLCNAYPGRASLACFEDFQRALSFGKPKYLYWTMWGNGTSTELDEYIGKVKGICDKIGITLIIIDRPNSVASDIQQTYSARKAVIDKYISLGVRYVNIALALSTDPSNPNAWYEGYLNSVDGKHPTTLGYQAIGMQVINDLPEICQY